MASLAVVLATNTHTHTHTHTHIHTMPTVSNLQNTNQMLKYNLRDLNDLINSAGTNLVLSRAFQTTNFTPVELVADWGLSFHIKQYCYEKLGNTTVAHGPLIHFYRHKDLSINLSYSFPIYSGINYFDLIYKSLPWFN